MRKLVLLTSLLGGCFVNVPAAQEQFLQRMCSDSQYAYEHGYNKAREGEPMSTRWSESCAPQVRGERVRAYMAGYQAAAQRQPVGAQINIGLGGGINGGSIGGGGGTTSCGYDSDCGPGRACRAIQGGNVCMGQGAAGDYCYYDNDCLSGQCDPATNAKYCR